MLNYCKKILVAVDGSAVSDKAENIIRLSRGFDADVIVARHTGKEDSGGQESLLGSVSAEIVDGASCSVYLVRA